MQKPILAKYEFGCTYFVFYFILSFLFGFIYSITNGSHSVIVTADALVILDKAASQ